MTRALALDQARISQFLVEKHRLTPQFTSEAELGWEGAASGFGIVLGDVCRVLLSLAASGPQGLLSRDKRTHGRSAESFQSDPYRNSRRDEAGGNTVAIFSELIPCCYSLLATRYR